MANWYVSYDQYFLVDEWSALATVAPGAIVRQTDASNPNKASLRCFRTELGGITGTDEPSWDTSQGATTAGDGTVDWVEVTGQEAYQAPGAWGAPFAHLYNAGQWANQSGGDTIYIDKDSVEMATPEVISIYLPGADAAPCIVASVNAGVSSHVPPQAADVAPGASIDCTGGSTVILAASAGAGTGFVVVNGLGVNADGPINLMAGASAANGGMVFQLCDFAFTGSIDGLFYQFGDDRNVISGRNGAMQALVFEGCTFSFDMPTQYMTPNCHIKWGGAGSSIGGSAVPTSLFYAPVMPGTLLLDGVDLSAITAGNSLVGAPGGDAAATFDAYLLDCKLAAGVTVLSPTSNQGIAGGTIQVARSAAGGKNYVSDKYQGNQGSFATSAVVVRTGGASVLGTPISWDTRATPPAGRWVTPMVAGPIVVPNATAGVARTLTLYGVGLGALTNANAWLTAEYLGTAGSNLATFKTTTVASYFALASAAALTADTSAWTATTRQNSHSYAEGDVIAVASNAGRIFFCTTAGMSAGSLPGAYASAVDGGNVTDGAATFTAGTRFKIALTLSSPAPAIAGSIYATANLATASADPVRAFLDPAIVVS